MRRAWAIRGETTRQLLSFGGRVLTHGNQAELQFLFPKARFVLVDTDQFDTVGLGWMELADHPELGHLRWPLRQVDFR